MEFMKSRNLELNLDTYNLTMDFYCAVNNFEKTFEIFKAMKLENIKPDLHSYCTLIRCIKKMESPNTTLVLRLLGEYEKDVEERQVGIYNSVIDLLGNLEQFDKVDEIFNRMEKMGV